MTFVEFCEARRYVRNEWYQPKGVKGKSMLIRAYIYPDDIIIHENYPAEPIEDAYRYHLFTREVSYFDNSLDRLEHKAYEVWRMKVHGIPV